MQTPLSPSKPPWSRAAFLFLGSVNCRGIMQFSNLVVSTQDHASASRTQQTCCFIEQLGF